MQIFFSRVSRGYQLGDDNSVDSDEKDGKKSNNFDFRGRERGRGQSPQR